MAFLHDTMFSGYLPSENLSSILVSHFDGNIGPSTKKLCSGTWLNGTSLCGTPVYMGQFSLYGKTFFAFHKLWLWWDSLDGPLSVPFIQVHLKVDLFVSRQFFHDKGIKDLISKIVSFLDWNIKSTGSRWVHPCLSLSWFLENTEPYKLCFNLSFKEVIMPHVSAQSYNKN